MAGGKVGVWHPKWGPWSEEFCGLQSEKHFLEAGGGREDQTLSSSGLKPEWPTSVIATEDAASNKQLDCV